MDPFLQNHQYNRIAQQAHVLLSALQTSTDRRVVEAVRYSAVSKAVEACYELSGEQLQLVQRLADLHRPEEFEAYLHKLSHYTVKFPEITENRLKSLFPKIKKLRLPEFTQIEGRTLTYLGWTDPATNRMFIVYSRPQTPGTKHANDLVGVEGRFTTANQKGVCAFCNRSGETALVTAISKTRISHLPDYYKAVGQYICLDSEVCNSRITELDGLERFFESVSK